MTSKCWIWSFQFKSTWDFASDTLNFRDFQFRIDLKFECLCRNHLNFPPVLNGIRTKDDNPNNDQNDRFSIPMPQSDHTEGEIPHIDQKIVELQRLQYQDWDSRCGNLLRESEDTLETIRDFKSKNADGIVEFLENGVLNKELLYNRTTDYCCCISLSCFTSLWSPSCCFLLSSKSILLFWSFVYAFRMLICRSRIVLRSTAGTRHCF
jgi:hypothetical protein